MSIPSQSFAVGVQALGVATQYFVVGPMAEGSWLRRVRVFWMSGAATTLLMGLALGGVNEASEVAYRGAGGLISPRDFVFHDKPAVGLFIGGVLGGWFEVPVGVQIFSGSKWLIGVVNTNTFEVDTSLIVALECLQATKNETQ